MIYSKNNNILFWPAKLPLLVIYLLFFAVQIFFNLDVNQESFNAHSKTDFSSVKSFSRHSANVKKAVAKSPSTTKIRLNKRFQPSNLPFAVLAIAPSLALLIEPLKIGSYTVLFYTSAIPYAHALRGPPSMA